MINKDLTRHLAELCALDFSDKELSEMSNDMNDTISVMDKVKEFDYNCCEKTYSAVVYADLREDSHQTSGININSKNNSFAVPKII